MSYYVKRERTCKPHRPSFSFSLYLSLLFLHLSISIFLSRVPIISACKRKDEMANQAEHQQPAPKKPRLVFTDLQRRTLQAIFKVSTPLARAHTHIHIHT